MDIFNDQKNKNAHLIQAVQQVHTQTIEVAPLATENLPFEHAPTLEGIAERFEFLKKHTGKELPHLAGKQSFTAVSELAGNIENYIGMLSYLRVLLGPFECMVQRQEVIIISLWLPAKEH